MVHLGAVHRHPDGTVQIDKRVRQSQHEARRYLPPQDDMLSDDTGVDRVAGTRRRDVRNFEPVESRRRDIVLYPCHPRRPRLAREGRHPWHCFGIPPVHPVRQAGIDATGGRSHADRRRAAGPTPPSAPPRACCDHMRCPRRPSGSRTAGCAAGAATHRPDALPSSPPRRTCRPSGAPVARPRLRRPSTPSGRPCPGRRRSAPPDRRSAAGTWGRYAAHATGSTCRWARAARDISPPPGCRDGSGSPIAGRSVPGERCRRRASKSTGCGGRTVHCRRYATPIAASFRPRPAPWRRPRPPGCRPVPSASRRSGYAGPGRLSRDRAAPS